MPSTKLWAFETQSYVFFELLFIQGIVVKILFQKFSIQDLQHLWFNCQLDVSELNLINPKCARYSTQELIAYFNAANSVIIYLRF